MSDRNLDVVGLNVTFPSGKTPIYAVRGVDLRLEKGECLGIVGESGSGKSVSAMAILGLLGGSAKLSGKIEFEGRNLLVSPREDLRRIRGNRIAMIFQEPSRAFDPIYSLEKTFEETFRAHDPKMTKTAMREKTIRLLTEVHIPQPESRLKSFPHQFSGGMLQRVLIALALANDPEILIADEPTTALDVTIQAQIVRLLKDLQVERGLSLIFISHNLDLVGQISDRILVMYGGLALEIGPTSRVLKQPHSPYTAALLASLPRTGDHYSQKKLPTIGGQVVDPARPEPGCPFAPRCSIVQDRCRSELPEPTVLSNDRGTYRCWVEGVKS